MLCQMCKKRNATTHYKQIINEQVTEYHLCQSCAEQQGYSNLFSDFTKSFENVFGSFLSVPKESSFSLAEQERCSVCSSTLSEIVKSGRAGCSECYKKFGIRMMPSIKRIHGNTSHVGKVPKTANETQKKKKYIDNLKEKLQNAITAQEFEKAAELRDEIRKLEGEGL